MWRDCSIYMPLVCGLLVSDLGASQNDSTSKWWSRIICCLWNFASQEYQLHMLFILTCRSINHPHTPDSFWSTAKDALSYLSKCITGRGEVWRKGNNREEQREMGGRGWSRLFLESISYFLFWTCVIFMLIKQSSV